MTPYNRGSVELGGQLRQQRKALGLTQAAAASRLGVSQTKWSRWEDGKVMPSPADHFANLADFLEVPRAEVFELAFGTGASTEERLARCARRPSPRRCAGCATGWG